jgi:transcription elongation factor Elf1
MTWLINALFGCRHRNTSRTFWDADAQRMYVVCLDCGQRYWYDWQEMRVLEQRPARVGELREEA